MKKTRKHLWPRTVFKDCYSSRTLCANNVCVGECGEVVVVLQVIFLHFLSITSRGWGIERMCNNLIVDRLVRRAAKNCRLLGVKSAKSAVFDQFSLSTTQQWNISKRASEEAKRLACLPCEHSLQSCRARTLKRGSKSCTITVLMGQKIWWFLLNNQTSSKSCTITRLSGESKKFEM
jgi:hypothetical protein